MGQNEALLQAINSETPPEAIQCVVNPLNSAGAIGFIDNNFDANRILKESQKSGNYQHFGGGRGLQTSHRCQREVCRCILLLSQRKRG